MELDIRHFRAFSAWLQLPLSTLLHETAAVRFVGREVAQFAETTGPIFFFHLVGDDIPPETVWGIEFESELLWALLDKLQGGTGVSEEICDADRRLTLLEKRLAERFLLLFQNAIRETWQLPEPFDFEPIWEWEMTKTVSVAQFRLEAGAIGGTFRIMRPAVLRQRISAVGLNSGDLLENGTETEEDSTEIVNVVASAPVRVSVQLAGRKVLPQDLLRWRVGDMISLGRPEDFPFSVLVEGTEKFTASPGRYKSRKAFRIL